MPKMLPDNPRFNQGEFPKSLRELREARGYTQESFAVSVGITRSTLASYENGRSEPKLKNFIAIARGLEVSLKDLARVMGYDVSNLLDD